MLKKFNEFLNESMNNEVMANVDDVLKVVDTNTKIIDNKVKLFKKLLTDLEFQRMPIRTIYGTNGGYGGDNNFTEGFHLTFKLTFHHDTNLRIIIDNVNKLIKKLKLDDMIIVDWTRQNDGFVFNIHPSLKPFLMHPDYS